MAKKRQRQTNNRHPELPFEPALIRPGDPLEEAALAFHLRNPTILPGIVRLCRQMKKAGYEQWGISAAFEVLRYKVRTQSTDFNLNNSHRAYFARWIMRDCPDLAGFFEIRAQGKRGWERGEAEA